MGIRPVNCAGHHESVDKTDEVLGVLVLQLKKYFSQVLISDTGRSDSGCLGIIALLLLFGFFSSMCDGDRQASFVKINSLTVSPDTINIGDTVTVRWNITFHEKDPFLFDPMCNLEFHALDQPTPSTFPNTKVFRVFESKTTPGTWEGYAKFSYDKGACDILGLYFEGGNETATTDIRYSSMDIYTNKPSTFFGLAKACVGDICDTKTVPLNLKPYNYQYTGCP